MVMTTCSCMVQPVMHSVGLAMVHPWSGWCVSKAQSCSRRGMARSKNMLGDRSNIRQTSTYRPWLIWLNIYILHVSAIDPAGKEKVDCNHMFSFQRALLVLLVPFGTHHVTRNYGVQMTSHRTQTNERVWRSVAKGLLYCRSGRMEIKKGKLNFR